MAHLRLSRRAELDLASIHDFIAANNSVAADNYVAGFFETFHRLATHPELGEVRTDLRQDLRAFVHDKYLILYYLPGADLIEVIGVLHGARDIKAMFQQGDR